LNEKLTVQHFVSFREALYESDELSKQARDSAALLASKVYYCLGEYDEALSFALGAGSAFEAEVRAHRADEYVETVICEWLCCRVFGGA
jgi:26S proteasome regulatory subunit N2